MGFNYFDIDLAGYGQWIFAILLLVTAIVHVSFAGGVARAAGREHREGRETIFVPAFVWFLATLAGGVPIAAIFWAMHFSAMRRRES